MKQVRLTVGVRGVARAVAEEVVGQHGDAHREHRQDEPRLMPTVCTFWASLSSTPQLVTGARSPRPRNDSEVYNEWAGQAGRPSVDVYARRIAY